jgi:hypothetical protein
LIHLQCRVSLELLSRKVPFEYRASSLRIQYCMREDLTVQITATLCHITTTLISIYSGGDISAAWVSFKYCVHFSPSITSSSTNCTDTRLLRFIVTSTLPIHFIPNPALAQHVSMSSSRVRKLSSSRCLKTNSFNAALRVSSDCIA